VSNEASEGVRELSGYKDYQARCNSSKLVLSEDIYNAHNKCFVIRYLPDNFAEQIPLEIGQVNPMFYRTLGFITVKYWPWTHTVSQKNTYSLMLISYFRIAPTPCVKGKQKSFSKPRVLNKCPKYRVFQKEIYNFESVCKFIQRTYTTF